MCHIASLFEKINYTHFLLALIHEFFNVAVKITIDIHLKPNGNFHCPYAFEKVSVRVASVFKKT
jgi:hypothetical protein